MRLVDRDPHWIHPNIFIFRCPCPRCGGSTWLSCKNVAMSISDQFDLLSKLADEEGAREIVPCAQGTAWNFQSGASFDTMTVTPSLDASNSGHWHGFITNGEIVGGEQQPHSETTS